MTFAELLKGLDTEAALRPPEGEYTKGEGLAAHTLMRLMVDPETPPAARISAAKEITDRCSGRPRQAEKEAEGDVRLSDLEKYRLGPVELDQLERLILQAWPRDRMEEE